MTIWALNERVTKALKEDFALFVIWVFANGSINDNTDLDNKKKWEEQDLIDFREKLAELKEDWDKLRNE